MGLILKTNSNMVANSLGNVRDLLTASEIVSQYIERVESDGGVVGNLSALTSISEFLVANKLAGKVRNLASASLGCKVDVSGNLIKLYDLFGSDLQPNYFTYANSEYTDSGTIPVDNARQLKYVAGSGSERPYILMNSSATDSFAAHSGGVLKEIKSQRIGALSSSLYCSTALFNESSRPTVTIAGFTEKVVVPTNQTFVIQVVPSLTTEQINLRSYDARNDTVNATGQFSTLELTKVMGGNPALSAFKNKKLISGRLDLANKTLKLNANHDLDSSYSKYSKTSRSIPSITAKANKSLHLVVPSLPGGSQSFGNIKVYDIVVMRDLDDQMYESMLEHLVSIVSI